MRFVGADAEVMELHLRLGPGEHYRPLKSTHRPERDACRGACWYSHAAAKTEDRIEYGPGRIGKWMAVDHRDWRTNGTPAPKETCSVRLELYVVRHPRARPPLRASS